MVWSKETSWREVGRWELPYGIDFPESSARNRMSALLTSVLGKIVLRRHPPLGHRIERPRLRRRPAPCAQRLDLQSRPSLVDDEDKAVATAHRPARLVDGGLGAAAREPHMAFAHHAR